MSDQDFLFALDVSGDPADDPMLTDLTRSVLRHVGYASGAVDAVATQLHGALAERRASGNGRSAIRFRSESGQLEIVVSGAGRADWRTTWPLPAS